MADEVRREWFDKDYYAVLGVPKNASAAEVKKAYRKLAQQHHPDTKQGDPDAETRFKEISAAYDVLGDAEKRKAYDQVRDMSASGIRAGLRAAGFRRGLAGHRRSRMAGRRPVRAGERRRHRRSVRRALRRGGEAERPPARRAAGRRSGDLALDLVRGRRWRGRPCRSRSTARPCAPAATDRGPSREPSPSPVLSAEAAARSPRTRGSSRCRGRARSCGGAGTDRRVPVHEVRRVRRGAADPHPAREDPGGRAQRRADPARRARANRVRRAVAPATSS